MPCNTSCLTNEWKLFAKSKEAVRVIIQQVSKNASKTSKSLYCFVICMVFLPQA